MLNSLPKVDIRGVEFRHNLSGSEVCNAIKLVDVSRAAVSTRVARLRESIQAGNPLEERGSRHWLLTSPEALLASAIAANRKLRPTRRRTLDECLTVPAAIDFAVPFPEIVPVRFKAKTGGWRAIHNPGLHHRTAQDVTLRVLGQYFRPKPLQFTQLGVHKAIEQVRTAIASGHFFVARLDIKEFYASFDPDELANELPLPAEVVEHAVIGRRMKVKADQGKGRWKLSPYYSPHLQDLLPLARLGIPTGSGSSPMVGMITLSHLAWAHMPGVIVVNYADDFLVLAQSATLRDIAVKALIRAVGDLPGGHFELKLKSEGQISAGVTFLGHEMKLQNGALKIKPKQSSQEAFYGHLNQLDTRFGNLVFYPGKKDWAAAIACAAEMYALVNGWIATFRSCDEITTRWAAVPLSSVADVLKTLGITAADIKAAVKPWMTFNPYEYALRG